jgi:hypothetical protein
MVIGVAAATVGSHHIRHGSAACWADETRGLWVPKSSFTVAKRMPTSLYKRMSAASGAGGDAIAESAACLAWRNDSTRADAGAGVCVRSAERYRWQPTGRDPTGRDELQIDEVRPDAFCRVMLSRGLRRVAFIGDSVTRAMAHSLWGSLGLRGFSQFGCHAMDGCAVTLRCPAQSNAILVHLLEVGQLSSFNESPPGQNKSVAANSSWSQMERVMGAADLILLNIGAHYALSHFNGSVGPLYRTYVSDLLSLAASFRRALDEPRQGARRLLVYRTTPTGCVAPESNGRLPWP